MSPCLSELPEFLTAKRYSFYSLNKEHFLLEKGTEQKHKGSKPHKGLTGQNALSILVLQTRVKSDLISVVLSWPAGATYLVP